MGHGTAPVAALEFNRENQSCHSGTPDFASRNLLFYSEKQDLNAFGIIIPRGFLSWTNVARTRERRSYRTAFRRLSKGFHCQVTTTCRSRSCPLWPDRWPS